MSICFFNNVYCCFLPAHTSHGLQPLDNGPYNALKYAYRELLSLLQSLNDSAPVDKINFIRTYAQARTQAFSKKTIESGFRTTGNWPVNRIKALSHPEIQADKEKTPEPIVADGEHSDDDFTPTTSRQIRDMGKGRSPHTRSRFNKAAKAYDNQGTEIAFKDRHIEELKAQIERLQPKKRRAIPNPNRRFQDLAEILGTDQNTPIATPEQPQEEEEEVTISGEEEEDDPQEVVIREPVRTRSGRQSKRPAYLMN